MGPTEKARIRTAVEVDCSYPLTGSSEAFPGIIRGFSEGLWLPHRSLRLYLRCKNDAEFYPFERRQASAEAI